MMKRIRLGISPCPNDTFIFYHLLNRQVLPFEVEPVIRDVEELNRLVFSDALHVSKVSFGLAGKVLDRYIILDSGAALGRGCGPLVLSRKKISRKELLRARIAIPGVNTTAALLLRLFVPKAEDLVEMSFNEIVGAICKGEVDAGCVIHETRFTYRDFGLELVQDLGKWWEETTKSPIPLGGIVAKRSISIKDMVILNEAIKKSMRFAQGNYHEVSGFIRRHAQEISQEVQRKHIDLYVNEYSYDLGEEGRQAISLLFESARKAGLIPWGADHEGPLFLSDAVRE